MRMFGLALFFVTLTYLLVSSFLEKSIRTKYPEYLKSLCDTHWNTKRLSDLLSRRVLPNEIYTDYKTLINTVKTLLVVQFVAFPILALLIYLGI